MCALGRLAFITSVLALIDEGTAQCPAKPGLSSVRQSAESETAQQDPDLGEVAAVEHGVRGRIGDRERLGWFLAQLDVALFDLGVMPRDRRTHRYVVTGVFENASLALVFAPKARDRRGPNARDMALPPRWHVRLLAEETGQVLVDRELKLGDANFMVLDPVGDRPIAPFPGVDTVIVEVTCREASSELRPEKEDASKQVDMLFGAMKRKIPRIRSPDRENEDEETDIDVEDHGRFGKDDIRVRHLQFKTAVSKYVLDLGPAAVKPGTLHRYSITGLPQGYVLGLGFGLPKVTAFRDETGIARLRIGLYSRSGLILMEDEYDTSESFNIPLPMYRNIQGVKWHVAEGGRNEDNWRFEPNTASGTQFVAARDEKYTLEITVLELVPEAAVRGQSMRPLIRSE